PRTRSHMTEQKETTKPSKPLTLTTTARSAAAGKGGETQVRQKFSHGRTRVVAVEVKKQAKRPVGTAAPAAPAASQPAASEASAPAAAGPRTLKLGAAAPAKTRTAPPPAPEAAAPRQAPTRVGAGLVLKTLTEEEKVARTRALVDANRDAEVARERALKDAERRLVEQESRRKADEEHKKRLAEEDLRKKSEEEAKRKT